MTTKTFSECDNEACDESYPGDGPPPDGWATLSTGSGDVRHFCPVHSQAALSAGVSGKLHYPQGEIEVAHKHPGEDYEYGYVRIGSHSIQLEALGAGKLPSGVTEGFGIYVHDHFSLEVRGAHKDNPRVTIDSDEFPTRLQIEDREHSFEPYDSMSNPPFKALTEQTKQ